MLTSSSMEDITSIGRKENRKWYFDIIFKGILI